MKNPRNYPSRLQAGCRVKAPTIGTIVDIYLDARYRTVYTVQLDNGDKVCKYRGQMNFVEIMEVE